MGTSCACIYATTTCCHHEQTKALPSHRKIIPLIGPFIDDTSGVWTGPNEEWPLFKESPQGFGKLLWITSDLSFSVIFLDLKLSFVPENSITYITYQKPLSLYLYTPSRSAHHPSCFNGTIIGNIILFW
jgi:hypothetical protein